MASEVDQALQPQPRAQRLQPPAITVNPRNCVDGEPSAAEPSIRSPRKPNGATQQEPERPAFFSDDEDNDSSSSRVSEPVPEQMTSPSVSSPPYWTHNKPASSRPPESNLRPHTPGHARAVSNASADSVLPPGAITLQDNEADEDENGDAGDGYRRSNSSEVYGRDRNRACWARSVQVTDYVLVNGGTTNLGAFVVWIIRVETFNGSYMNIRKRYSEFDDLRRRLVQTFPNFEAAVPALPPKSLINRFRSKFLEKRRAGLQYFLNCILLNPEFSGSPVLKEFLFT